MEQIWKRKTPEWMAAWAALISGVVAHCFGLVHILHNYDNILQQPTGYGNGITLGRWLLAILGDLSENLLDLGYNFPVVNGLCYLILIALSAALVVRLLKIRSWLSAVLAGCLMSTFPTVCATMLFRFTAGYYGLCLLLSVLAAWVVGKPKCGIFLSALFTALALGIYQAYTPVTIGLFVLMLMRDSLEEDADLRKLVAFGIRCCISLVLGLVLYFVLLKLTLAVYASWGSAGLDGYLGINEMGQIKPSELPYLLKKAWCSAVLFPLEDYCQLATTRTLKLLWAGLLLLTAALGVYLLVKRRLKPLNAAFCCLMAVLFPLAVNFQVIMSPQGTYTVMMYSFVLMGCAPLMLLELLPPEALRVKGKPLVRAAAGVLLALIVFYNGYNANYHYTALYYANRQVENYLSGMVAQIRMTEGFTPEKKWAFLGMNRDPMLWDIWDTMPRYGGMHGCSAKGLMNVDYSFSAWFDNYIGCGAAYATEEEKQALREDPRVEQMPCWPSQGSMQVIDDYLVVKFQKNP